jgi:hypothetical protein
MVTHISPAGGGTYSLPIAGVDQIVLGENGAAFATGADASNGSTVTQKLLSFDMNSGQVAWVYENPISIIAASAGNGIVAQGTDLSGVTKVFQFDSNGVPAFKLASDRPVGVDWFGRLYDAGGLSANTDVDLATSFWVTPFGSPSPMSVSIETSWFPELDHCTTAPGCIGHYEAIYNALDDLISRLNNAAINSLAQTAVFDKLGTDQNGSKFTTAGFINYLSQKRPRLYDGTTSTYCKDSLDSGSTCFKNWFLAFFNGTLVKDAFASPGDTSALTQTPGQPLLVFVRPSAILFASSGMNIGNEGLLFHEGLHGYTGLLDRGTVLHPNQLMERLGINPADKSCAISDVLSIDVLSHSSGLDPTKNSCE